MTQLFDREAILGALADLAARLADGDVTTRVCVVGGAALAISRFGNRAATTDIDVAVYGHQDEVMAHVRALAETRGWPVDWVNTAVVQFWPFSGEPRWTPVVSRDAVEILVAPADMLLAMKLNAGRGRRDSGDIAELLEVCGISTVDEAEDIFQQYYPGEEMKDRARAQVVAAFS
jgi:hypothetical protein